MRSRGSARRPPTSPLYHVGNDPDAHGWIVDALWKRPGVVVLHEFVLHHLIAGITIGRGNGRGYLDAMERDLGVAGRLLGLGVLDNLLPLLWETQPERFPLAGVVLDHAHGRDRPLRLRRAERARRRATTGGSGASRIPSGRPSPSSRRATCRGDPLIGCFGFLNMNKRIPQLLEAFALAAPAPAGRAAAARRRGRRAVRRRAAASSGSG